MCDGSQQDIAEFIEIMLEELEKELSEISFDAAHLLQKFYGTKIEEKTFLETAKGCCLKCGYYPLTHETPFKMMKLYVQNNTTRISLIDLIEQNYSGRSNRLKMRCSQCNDENKEAVANTRVSKSPSFLLVSLNKFPQYNCRKISSIV